MIKYILTLIITLISLSSNSQESSIGQEFWFTFLENLEIPTNGLPQFSIFVSAEEEGIAVVRSDLKDVEYEINYAASEFTEIILTDSIWHPIVSEEITDLGLRLTTSTPVNAYAFHFRRAQSDASIIYPIGIIGSEYIINTSDDSRSIVSVVATEDYTAIEIIPTSATSETNHPAGEPINIILHKGETYQITGSDDLSGTRVFAHDQKKIAVFSGARFYSLSCDGQSGGNQLYDQLLPTNLLGKKYALLPFRINEVSIFKITALYDETVLNLETNDSIELNADQTTEINTDKIQILNSNKEVLVSQIACNNGDLGDPNLLHILPIELKTNKSLFRNIEDFVSSGSFSFTEHTLSLVKKSTDVDPIYMNNIDILNEFKPIENDTTYAAATIILDDDIIALESTNRFQAYLHGAADHDAYSIALGFSQDNVSSAESTLDNINCKLYPNPTSGLVHIDCSNYSSITVLDLSGRILFKANKQENLDLSNLDSGFYYIFLENKLNRSYNRIIKM